MRPDRLDLRSFLNVAEALIHDQVPGASPVDVGKMIDGWADELEKRLMPAREWGTSPRQQAALAAAEAMFGPA